MHQTCQRCVVFSLELFGEVLLKGLDEVVEVMEVLHAPKMILVQKTVYREDEEEGNIPPL